MRLEDIKALPIQNIVDKNCYLFLWVTAPRIKEGLDVLQYWGFDFFTIAFTWVKTNSNSMGLFWGMGNATRANPEYVLLGRRGRLDRLDKAVHSVILSPIQIHSRKPGEIRERIVRLYGDLPRIELFARRKVEGWDCWGNEVESDIEL